MSLILGVLGARNALTKQIMQDEVLNPILDDLAKRPIKILLPAESLSSTFIECWANRQDIETELIKSDWIRDGKRASIVRDYRIEKEANVLLVFEGPRSRYYLNLAERIAKKRHDCSVYVVPANSVSPVLLEVDPDTRFNITDKEEKTILTLPQMWGQQKCLIVDD
jgi:Txe/YoeB family toxin of Txe-Axe toxin-antitoxin module